MSDQQYSEDGLQQQALIDSDQWGRLVSELGLDMLGEFAGEFFMETREQWFDQPFDPEGMEPRAFRSMAHRSAGAAGTIGFKRLRYVFLCMEHNEVGPQTHHFFALMKQVFADTEQWVKAQQ